MTAPPDVDARIAALAVTEASGVPEPSVVGLAVRVVRRVMLDPLVQEDVALRTLAFAFRDGVDAKVLAERLAAAEAELHANVARVERHHEAGRPVGAECVDRLARSSRLLARIRAASASDESRERSVVARVLAHAIAALPPVALPFRASAPELEEASVRRIAIGLGTVDTLTKLALEERNSLARRRALLESARRALLDVTAKEKLPTSDVEGRRARIATSIGEIDRVVATGVSPRVGLVHQARHAQARGDSDRLLAVLHALEHFAGEASDADATRRTRDVIEHVFGDATTTPAARLASQERSYRELFGARAVDELARACTPLRASWASEWMPNPGVDHTKLLATLGAMHAADGALEVCGTLTPTRIDEPVTVERRVRHPTAKLELAPAEGIADLPHAIVDDPRAVLHDLVTGKLLTRRFVAEETKARPRTVLSREGRFYLLDGSSSMTEAFGAPRAQARDAILLAELATALGRFEQLGGRVRIGVSFRYFTDVVWPVVRVRTSEEAIVAMHEVVSARPTGGTDIERALLQCFADIRLAAKEDPDLGTAQIVLITDGEARVDEAVVSAARASVGELAIRVSVIALGQENPALREIVAKQRADGELAFYQHLTDDEIRGLFASARTDRALHRLAAETEDAELAERTRARQATLSRECAALLEELADLERGRDAAQLAEAVLDAEAWERAAMEIDFLPGPALSATFAAGERRTGDARALRARFDRWFPAIDPASGSRLPASGDTLAAVTLVLGIAEVVALLDADPWVRRADALAILEGALGPAGLDVVRYGRLLLDPGRELAEAILAVRSLVEPARA